MISLDAGEAVLAGGSVEKLREIGSAPRHVVGDHEGEQSFIGGDDAHAGGILCETLTDGRQSYENEGK